MQPLASDQRTVNRSVLCVWCSCGVQWEVTRDVVRCGVVRLYVRIYMTWIFSPLSLSLSHSGPCNSHDAAVAFLE